MYWAELITCLAHLPPGVSFEWGNLQLDNYVVYRCAFDRLRVSLMGNSVACAWKTTASLSLASRSGPLGTEVSTPEVDRSPDERTML